MNKQTENNSIMMLEELLKEINKLKKYKKLYECAVKDKERMSELLYEYMTKEYENITREEKIAQHKEKLCRSCRYRDYCREYFDDSYSEDIGKPIPSDKAWIPGRVTCGKFEWA